MEEATTSPKPYIIRALYEWIVDNRLTPHIAVNVNCFGVVAPKSHAKNGTLILNISSSSVAHLLIGNDAIEFKARFGGVSHNIFIPITAITSIYARENNQGMEFEITEETAQAQQSKKVPKFNVISGNKTE